MVATVAREVFEHLLTQKRIGQMHIDVGGGDGFVSKQLLDDTQVGSAFEQVGGKGVAQGVWTDVALNAGQGGVLAQVVKHGDA